MRVICFGRSLSLRFRRRLPRPARCSACYPGFISRRTNSSMPVYAFIRAGLCGAIQNICPVPIAFIVVNAGPVGDTEAAPIDQPPAEIEIIAQYPDEFVVGDG